MIIKQEIFGFIQQVTPRMRYDRPTSRFTAEPDLDKNGVPRYTLLVAIPGERETLRVTASETLLGQNPEALQGQIVKLSYTAKVELAWASADTVQVMGGESA